MRVDVTPPTDNYLAITVRKNITNTDLTVTIWPGEVENTIESIPVSFAFKDNLSIAAVASLGLLATKVMASLILNFSMP